MIRRRRSSLPRFFFGLALMWLLFLPGLSGGDHRLVVDARPPLALIVLLGLIALLALAGRKLWPRMRWVLAGLLLVSAGLQLANAGVERLLDRPLDLYFDLRHVPNLIGVYLAAAGIWRGLAVCGAVLSGLALALVLLWRALIELEHGVARPQVAFLSLLAAALGLATLFLPADYGAAFLNRAAAEASWRQASTAWRAFAVLHGLDHRYDSELRKPLPPTGPLPGLKGRDVYLIFVESYGTVVLDDPLYRKAIAPALKDFATTAGTAGYRLVSRRLVSPTYGGGSWLAHGTLASGLKLDPLLAELIENSQRKSLPRYLAAAGYRTVEIMPGIKKPYPEGAFWGFDDHAYAKELGYGGPEFGWFDIPDQYTLAQFQARELKPGHRPLFAQLVLVSSHTPFAPVPPYLADWRDVSDFKTVPQAEWDRIYAEPDWTNLDRPYLDSIAYDLKTLGAWLARLEGDPLVIILGDHQPPDLTRGGNQPWTVPIHVLSRDPDLVQPFAALGYVDGATPPVEAKPEGMERFLEEFLSGFSASVATAASTPRQSPDAPPVYRP